MNDFKSLSKHKYVFFVYGDDETLHIQKFPVIYANKNNVYYKNGGNEDLIKIPTYVIHEQINTDSIDIMSIDTRTFSRYAWAVAEDFKQTIYEYRNTSEERKLRAELMDIERKYYRTKKNLELLRIQRATLIADIRKLGEKEST